MLQDPADQASAGCKRKWGPNLRDSRTFGTIYAGITLLIQMEKMVKTMGGSNGLMQKMSDPKNRKNPKAANKMQTQMNQMNQMMPPGMMENMGGAGGIQEMMKSMMGGGGMEEMIKAMSAGGGPDMSQLASMMGGMDMSQMANMMGMGDGVAPGPSTAPISRAKPKRK